MIRLLVKVYPFAAPIVWLWFWAALFELTNPAVKWYCYPLMATMVAVFVYLLVGAFNATVRIMSKVK